MSELTLDVGRPDGDRTALTASVVLPAILDIGAAAVQQRAIAVVVSSDDDYAAAVGFINEIKAMAGQLDKDRVRLKEPFLNGCREIDAYFKRPITVLEESVARIKTAMVDYDNKRRLLAQEAARKAEEERREREAEAKRKADEAQAAIRRQQEAQQAARDAAAAGDREAAIEARRKALRAEAETAAAVSTMDEAAKAASAPIAAPAAPATVAGVARRTVWKWRLKPGADVVAMIQDARIPAHYLKLNEDHLQMTVDRLKELAQRTLGDWIEVYSEETLAVGKGRGK
jgi:DNA repair exonuclease SbcCD ATPase subunit